MGYSLKITDFVGSLQYDENKEMLGATQGTAYYSAPEVLNKDYDERCDVWSIGVILYTMLAGQPPFEGDNDQEIAENIRSGQYSMKGGVWQQISDDAKRFIGRLLTYDY